MDRREKHKKLASVIKGVHKHLRRKLRESEGDYEAVWENHANDNDRLKSYATAMKQLATDHWSEYPESRIDWCYQAITEYFLQGGLQKALAKDAKHKYFERQRQKERALGTMQEINDLNSDSVEVIADIDISRESSRHPVPLRLLDVGSCYNPFRTYPNLEPIAVDLCPADSSVLQCDFLQVNLVPFDVPLSSFSSCCAQDHDHHRDNHHHHLKEEAGVEAKAPPQSTLPPKLPQKPPTPPPSPPTTLSPPQPSPPQQQQQPSPPQQQPARPLPQPSLPQQRASSPPPPSQRSSPPTQKHTPPPQQQQPSPLTPQQQPPPQPTPPYFLDHPQSPIQHLPTCSFDVVVFCLLLEYLPSPLQRARCCVKAVRLLKLNGLLLIITPDSKSLHRNAPLMKSWKTALGMLGMARWKYHKKQHLHCMAFRKVTQMNTDVDDDVITSLENQTSALLYIPQDFTDACYDDVPITPKTAGTQEDEDVRCLKECRENEDFRTSVFEELPSFCDDSD